jgi:hypothetical protein
MNINGSNSSLSELSKEHKEAVVKAKIERGGYSGKEMRVKR